MEVKNRFPMTIVNKVVILFLLLHFTVRMKAQMKIDDDNIRALIFMSIELDGPYMFNMTKYSPLMKLYKNHYDNLEYEKTKASIFYLSGSLDTIRSSYKMSLYKITDINSRGQSRYIIHYTDFYCDVWLRVSGYFENDLKLFFDYLVKQRHIKRKKLQSIINEWEHADLLYRELNLSCLLKGYFKNSTKSDCYISASYVRVLDASIGFDPIEPNDIHSIFSRVPLYGYLIKRGD